MRDVRTERWIESEKEYEKRLRTLVDHYQISDPLESMMAEVVCRAYQDFENTNGRKLGMKDSLFVQEVENKIRHEASAHLFKMLSRFKLVTKKSCSETKVIGAKLVGVADMGHSNPKY